MKTIILSFYNEINIAIQSYSGAITFIIKIVGAIILPFILQTIIHELGHLIFGLISGYKPWIFKVFNVALIKDKGKYRVKICSRDGCMGQCLMLPQIAKIETSNKDKENYPYALYNLGGILLNLIVGILSLYLLICLRYISFYAWLFIALNAFYGLGFAVINGMPFIDHTDGHNYLLLKIDNNALKSYYHQFYIFYQLSIGKTYGEIPYEYIKVEDRCDLSNPLIAFNKIIEIYYYMDLKKWGRAKACIEELKSIFNKLSEIDRQTIQLEELYLSIVIGEPLDKIVSLYKNIENYMEKNKKDINIIRVNTAYEIYQNSNFKDYKKIINKQEKYSLYKGIYSFTYNQLEIIKIYK